MTLIWTVQLFALLAISFGYKLPRGEFKDIDTYNKGAVTMEDPSTANSTAANLFEWLSHNIAIELDNNLSRGSRMRRDVTEEDDSLLEEMTTASEENQTTPAVTIKSGTLHVNPMTEETHTHQTDIQSTQPELNKEETSHIFVTHSTMQETTTSTGLDIFEISVTNAASTESLATSQTTDPTLQPVPENTTPNLSTGFVDPGFRASATPPATLSTTSSFNPTLVDKPDSTTSKPGVTNEENTPPEKQNIMHSLMAQCLLAISILAFIALVFIICTIVLATKLSKLRNRYKLLTKNSTEMVCISSLLPENDQSAGKTKVKASKLKTFAATLDDGEGDNLTLNSFLPEH